MTTYKSDMWDDWMRAALADDKESYMLLLSNLRPWLVAYFSKRIHQHSVEDLVQDTLMSLHSKRQTFDPDYPFGPWISAIARHRWIDHMRKTLKYVETQLDDDLSLSDSDSEVCAKHDLATLLKLIPPAQAQIIEMVKIRSMSVKEVAARTGHSQSSVKTMVHRGMKKMMVAVKEVGDE